jgi:hypothetical protein
MHNLRRQVVRVAMVGLVVAFAGACGSIASPSSTATTTVSETPSPVPSASQPPTASPPPTTQPTAAASPLALCATASTPCPVSAGTYSTAPFVHPFLITIGDGWTNDRRWPHGGELAAPSGLSYLEWGSDFTGNGPSGASVKIGPTADDVFGYLASIADFTVSPPLDVTLGGKTGRSVDVSTNSATAPGFLHIAEDSYNLGPGEKARFMVFEIDGSAVVIMVEVPKEKDFEAEMATMQPTLDTIVWQ